MMTESLLTVMLIHRKCMSMKSCYKLYIHSYTGQYKCFVVTLKLSVIPGMHAFSCYDDFSVLYYVIEQTTPVSQNIQCALHLRPKSMTNKRKGCCKYLA